MSFRVMLVGSVSSYEFIKTDCAAEAIRVRDEVRTQGYNVIIADNEMVEITPARLAALIATMLPKET